MSDLQHCINCLRETEGFYPYPCQQCGWSPDQYGVSGLYLSPGTILHNQYQIARMLGHGGFGITYLAWDNLLEIKLAIKEYLPRDFATRNSTNAEVSTFAGDAKENFAYGLERFLEEARTLAKFQQHAGIVSVLNFFKGNGTGYMVMEYVDGLTLKDYLTDKGKLPWDQTLKLFMPVMDALREVHKHGVLHRDISPDNIYLCQDNRIKLLDFGSARYALGGHSRSLSVVVKPGYAPEEQYRGKGKQGAWTDVYSVAASMYRCVTGVVPPEALDRLDEDELLRPSELGVQIPAEAEEALMLALAVKADNRIQSIEEFQQALWEKSAATLDKEKTAVTESVKPATTSIEKAIVLFNLQDYEQAFCLFEYEAKRGDAKAQHYLGLMYEKGQGVTQNRQLAAQWYQKASGQGLALGSANLSRLHEPSKNDPVTSVYVDKQKRWDSYGNWLVASIGLFVIGLFLVHFFFPPRSQRESDPVPPASSVAATLPSVEDGVKFYDQGNYDQALKVLRPAAEQGDAKAENYLGRMYSDGHGVQRDDQQAVQWYLKAAEQGHSGGQESLGGMYKNGYGVGKDYQKAVEWYRKAAEQGDALGQFNLGYMYFNGYGVSKDYKKTVEWYRKAAEQGNDFGQYSLGVMYFNGYGVDKDYKKAVEWFQKAAERGFALAQYNLGNIYLIQKDDQQAVQWFQKAAEQGLADAETKLGWMYDQGQGVQKDHQQAAQWYRKAADQGFALAQYNLGFMYNQGRGVQQVDQQAMQWYRKAAEQGLAIAQYSLGLMYAKGQGVAQDFQHAEKWFSKAAKQGDKDAIKALIGMAAEQGNAAAQYKTGLMFAKGDGVQQDYQQAEQWFRKAAKQDDKNAIRALKGMGISVESTQDNPADKAAEQAETARIVVEQSNLGDKYMTGDGVQQDYQQAAQWYRKAAEQDDAKAQFNLGWMYEGGRGVQQDNQQAEQWYRKSAQQGYASAINALKHMGVKQ